MKIEKKSNEPRIKMYDFRKRMEIDSHQQF